MESMEIASGVAKRDVSKINDTNLLPKDEVSYRAAKDLEESCGACSYFSGKTCSIVEGPIDASMVCDEFSPVNDEVAETEEPAVV